MNRNAIQWIVVAIAVLGLAALCVILGVNLLPSRMAAQEKGTLAPWLLTWGMIWLTALTAVTLAGFLFVTGVSKVHRSQ